MKLPITVAYVSVDDPNDRRSWSGTNHFLLRALQAQVATVKVFGPLRPQPELFLCQAINQAMLRTTGKRFNYRDSFVLSKAYARLLGPHLHGVDLIVAPAGLATTALLRTKAPIVHINDRCIAGAIGYHRILNDLASFSLRESLALEQQALKTAGLTVYASSWAADAAMKAVPEEASKVKVVPFGANLEQIPSSPAARGFPRERIKLLFLGVNWEDKGGPIALQALRELKKRGVAAQLVVCGCTPPADITDPDMLCEGFRYKNEPVQAKRLEEHLRAADMLILPTRFEAYGIVCCEAAAYGLPVLATRTGGIPTIVQEGVTGFLFDMNEDGVAYADRVMRLAQAPDHWQAMRTAARARSEQVLNWTAFTHELLRLAQEVLSVNKAR
ncbi:MAG: glycosyltransferase family 4 protein [Flavobacteriales bacterium]